MVTTTLPSLLLASLSLLAQSTGTTAAPLDLYQRSSFLEPVSRSAPPSTSNNRLEFHFSKRHQQWPRTLHQRQRQLLSKRQTLDNGTGTASNDTEVDDQGELLNFEDTRYIATLNLAGQDLDLILDTGSTDTFVYSEQPLPFAGLDPSTLPPLFDNATAVGVVETGLTYEASYGSGNGITQTLGAIELADAEVNGTDLIARNLTYANLYASTSATGASGLLGLGFPINGEIWLQMVELYYNTTGEWPTTAQSSAYYPIVPLMHAQGTIAANLFSLEVSRLGPRAIFESILYANNFNYTENGGILTLGDYPEGTSESDYTWSDVPIIRFTEAGQARGFPAATGNRWTLPLEYIFFNGKRLDNTTLQPSVIDDGGVYYALLDSGNPSISIPSDMMEQITNAYAGNRAGLTIPCDTPFDLVFQMGGQNFSMNSTDFLVPSYAALDSLAIGGRAVDNCQFQAQPNRPYGDEIGPRTSITYQLGDPFLRNVYSVFDYGSLEDAEDNNPRIGLRQRTD